MKGVRPFQQPLPVKAPALSGRWCTRYQIDDEAHFRGRFVVEDEDGMVIAVVPFGIGEGRLGYVKAEQVAKAIAELPQEGRR